MNWYMKCLRQYADFAGRARRSEFWTFVLINFALSLLVKFVFRTIFGAGPGALVEWLFSCSLLLPTLAVGVRRLHDVGRSGWFLLIPFYNLYLCVQDSQAGSNTYGTNPKA